jgi:hypothetical protein
MHIARLTPLPRRPSPIPRLLAALSPSPTAACHKHAGKEGHGDDEEAVHGGAEGEAPHHV